METDRNLGSGHDFVGDLKLGNRSGIKRVSEEIRVELEGLENEDLGFEKDGRWKKVRVFEGIEEGVPTAELERVGVDFVCDGLGRTGETNVKWEFDLNEPAVEEECGGREIDIQEGGQIRPRIDEWKVEVSDISSDENEEIVKSRDDRGKGKEPEDGYSNEITQGLDLDFDLEKSERKCGGGSGSGSSISMSGGRRYTREEKGKAKIDESWLSLATYPTQVGLSPEMKESMGCEVYEVSDCTELYEAAQLQEVNTLERLEKEVYKPQEAKPLGEDVLERLIEESEASRRRAMAARFREVVKQHGPRLAQANPQDEEYKQEVETPSVEADIKLEDLPGAFSSALKIIKERNIKQGAEKLIKWKAIPNHNSDIRTLHVPSLLDLSLKALAKNAKAIASLDHVPDWLKRRLINLLCDARKMDTHILDLVVGGSPTEIRVKDCSWITEEQFGKTFGEFDTQNLRVLQLDLCGQCPLEGIIYKSLARSSNSLPCLGILSMRGACRLSDNALKALLKSAPVLQSINLGQCSLLTSICVKVLAEYLGSSLRELYIDDCPGIDAMLIVPSLKKFDHLEVLSVAGIDTVGDEFVRDIITACGGKIKELDLADCVKLTDASLKVIAESCPELFSLKISNLHKLTDLGMRYLANGCRSIQALKLCRNKFSDEAIAAFLETSGESLKELSLNGVSKVGLSTAMSLTKCSRKLSSLDLSWCRRITDEALGLIVDSCLSLKLLKLFGCTQITSIFLNGHSNSLVEIVGLSLTLLLKHINMFEPQEVLLHYSPLLYSEASHSADNQNV